MYRPETSNFLVCALLKRDTIEFYLIDYFNFVIVDNTTGNIVSIVTELAQSGVFTASCYCGESQLRKIEARTIRPPEIVFQRTIYLGLFSLSIRVLTCTYTPTLGLTCPPVYVSYFLGRKSLTQLTPEKLALIYIYK